MTVQRVTSMDLPELEIYRTLRRPVEHARQGIFVAEGEKVVRRLLESGLEMQSMLVTPDWLENLRHSGHLKHERSMRIYLAEADLLRQIVGFNIHQGIMAVARVPAEPSIDRIPDPHLLVALDGLRTSENVGVIVRNCAAFGVDAILVGETSCSPYLRRAVRNSMGAVFKIPVVHVPKLADTLQTLRMLHQTRIVAADPHGAANLYNLQLTGNVCIVLGNEDDGISAAVSTLADARVMIPMRNETDSLNVGSASAVFLFEAARRRKYPI